MKRTLLAVALLATLSGAAVAQNSDSTSNSGSQSGSTSTSGANAIGNVNASQSNSGSASRADSGSISGAMGNNVTLNQNTPAQQTINSNLSGTTTSNNNTTVNGTTREIYDGTLRQIQSGTATQNVVSSGGVNNTNYSREDVHYSGSQTIKNVPSIAMSGPASGPCTGVSGGVGISGPGWGVGFNGSTVMADCRLRENTRVMGMAMQSLDGANQPREKGEATVMFMDALRGLAAYNNQILASEVQQPKAK
jgi:hypothetical protein